MKIIGTGTTSKGVVNARSKEVIKRYFRMLRTVLSFAVTSTAFVMPIFMVFAEGSSPWYLILPMLVLLALVCSAEVAAEDHTGGN